VADKPINIEAAGLPFVVYDRAGARVEEAAMVDVLAGARAVCIGESHTNPHHHWMQLHLLDALSQRAGGHGAALAIGLEMFQAPFQHVLDAYASRAIDDRVLLARSEWRKRWGYDFAFYRPMVHLAVERGMSLLALNQRKEITRKVGKEGVEALSEEERAALPELDFDDADHRAWFDEVMSEHPDTSERKGAHGEDRRTEQEKQADRQLALQRIYSAQVLWDETMAHNAATWLAADDSRRVVIFAGNGHCHDSAIVRRLARRGVEPAVSVLPVVDDGEGSADEALRAQHNDYVVVMELPKG
jgi:uncharacterized iron-regulated protein